MGVIGLILVYSSSHAIALQKKLAAAGLSAQLSTIPRGVSSDCGVCVRFDPAEQPAVEAIVASFPYEIQEIIRYNQHHD